eukprot:maker-scaffold_7-snap-gene-17.29-mRNA-1 protein AED:0.00 eAED:0.00 QI:55/1/1/1/0.5/0.33/3/72/578
MGNSQAAAKTRALILVLPEKIMPEENTNWNSIFSTIVTPKEMYSLLTIEDAENILEKQEQNFNTLLKKACGIILNENLGFDSIEKVCATCVLARLLPVVQEAQYKQNISIYEELRKISSDSAVLLLNNFELLPMGLKQEFFRLILSISSQSVFLEGAKIKQWKRKTWLSKFFNELFKKDLIIKLSKILIDFAFLEKVTKPVKSLATQNILLLLDFDFSFSNDLFLNNADNILLSMNTSLNATLGMYSSKRFLVEDGEHQELFSIFWYLVSSPNSRFLENICENKKTIELTMSLLRVMLHSKNSAAHVGIFHVAVFILLVLSSKREYCILITTSDEKFSSPLSGNIRAIDFVFEVFCEVILGNFGQDLNKLFPCLITILCNFSPYIKNLGVPTCNKLFSLFSACSKKVNYIYLLLYFIDLFNNILQYQYNENENLVYGLISHSTLIQNVLQLDFSYLLNEANNPEQIRRISEEVKSLNATLKKTEYKKVEPLKAFYSHILPLIGEKKISSEDELRLFIQNISVVGILPVPHPIVVRKYEKNEYTDVWFTTFVYGLVFLKNKEVPLWDDERIKLFSINVV